MNPWLRLAKKIGAIPDPGPYSLEAAIDEMGPHPADLLEPDNALKARGALRDKLMDFLDRKDLALWGDVALRGYGGRSTCVEDYDLLVAPEAAKEVRRFLRGKRGVRSRTAAGALDVEALKTARLASWHGRRFRVVAPGPLAAMLLRGRELLEGPARDFATADLVQLMAAGAATPAELRACVKRFDPERLPALAALLKGGRDAR